MSSTTPDDTVRWLISDPYGAEREVFVEVSFARLAGLGSHSNGEPTVNCSPTLAP